MIENLLRGLRQPEYVHTLLNPLPIYGLGIALLSLILALSFRNRPAQIIALILTFVSAVSIWPVVHYGEKALDRVLILADEDGRAWLEEHEERAERLMYFFYALAVVSALAVAVPRKWPRTALPLTLATVALTIASLGAGAFIASAGGRIRHREFRTVPPPTKEAAPEPG